MSKKQSAKETLDENIAKINTRIENTRATEKATEAILEQLNGKEAEVRKLPKTKANAKDINELKDEIQYLKSAYKSTLVVIKEWTEDWDELVNKYHELQIVFQNYDNIAQSCNAWQTKYFELQLEKESIEHELAEKERAYNVIEHNCEKVNAECAQWQESCDKLTAVLNETADSVTIDSDEYNSLVDEVEELKSELADYKYIFHLLRTR